MLSLLLTGQRDGKGLFPAVQDGFKDETFQQEQAAWPS
jgi:hypothetical protein